MASKKKSAPSARRAIPQPGGEEPRNPIDRAVDSFFEHTDNVRTAVSRNVRAYGADTLDASQKAKAAFAQFVPSKYSTAQRRQRNFVPAQESPARMSRAVLDKGIGSIRASATRRTLRVHTDSAVGALMNKESRGTKAGTVALGDLLEYVTTRIGTSLTAPSGAAFTECRAEIEAQRRLDEIMGGNGADPDGGTAHGRGGGNGTTGGRSDTAANSDADALVNEQVQTQMSTATSPEGKLRFAVASRSDPKQTDETVETFELRAGPSDVTSYHDFNSLQIAFEHVWTEMFDGRLHALGQELYHEYVKLQQFVGVPPDERSIDTIDDLKRLMADIRELGKVASEAIPSDLQPKTDPTATTPNSTDTVVDAVKTVLDPASLIADAIGDETVAAIVDPAGALIDAIGDLIRGVPQIKWSSFPGPLPGNADLIQVDVQENVASVGEVEIELKTSSNTHGWKGIAFTEFDENNKVKSAFKISNDPNDQDVWNRAQYNVLPLYTPQVGKAMLEFSHEGLFGVHTRCYVMAALSEKLTERRRVTFTWLKD